MTSAERWLVVAMLGAVLAFAAMMLRYERLEFDAGMRALQDEQIALATAIAADFEARPLDVSRTQNGILRLDEWNPSVWALLSALHVEQPRSRMLMIRPPQSTTFVTVSGRKFRSARLANALDSGARGIELPREEAARLGLPPLIAAAGLSRVKDPSGTWGLVVLASSQRLRARERDAQVRFVLGLSLVSILVATFGGLALRQQRKRFEVARELEIAALAQERDRLLARADKMAALAALSSGVAHEIATPLGTILARIEQVAPAVSGDAKSEAALRIAMEQVERIQVIIRSLLGLARGQRSTLLRALPGELMENARRLVEHRFRSKAVRLTVAASRDLGELTCDPPLIEQALANVLLNACDASARGALVVLRAQSEGEKLAFMVDDEGDGITSEAAATATRPFVTTKASVGGAGLGLAIVHEIVSSHGGRFAIGPREPRGTRAIIELPHT